MRSIHSLILSLGLLCGLSVYAAPVLSPEETLQQITTELTAQIKKDQARIRSNPERINPFVESIVIPHMDFYYMSRWVLGRATWNTASEDQKKRFETAFEQLLIHTYASVVIGYANETITYLPSRRTSDDQDRVQVESTVTQSGGDAIHMVYRLIRKDTEWKVYDVVIEGVSLMKGFQSQFEEDLKKGGIDGLIKRLQDHYTLAPIQPKVKAKEPA